MPLFSRLFGGRPDPQHTTDSPELIRQNIAEGKAVMLDVRGQDERDAGHLAGSIFISISTIKALPVDATELEGLDKDKIVYCH